MLAKIRIVWSFGTKQETTFHIAQAEKEFPRMFGFESKHIMEAGKLMELGGEHEARLKLREFR
eukprot:11572556-Heterocapsa_arctica.AAC.1